MKSVCNPSECMMCGACLNICKNGCLMQIHSKGKWYVGINKEKCVDCGLCKSVCVNNHSVEYHQPEKLLVSWAKDIETRKTSASGGVASVLYKHAINNGYYVVGVSFGEDFFARYSVTNDSSLLSEFRNSKYTYSDLKDCFLKIAELLRSDEKILFIGLPCQVAAICRYLTATKIDAQKLITVDIVCHGTPEPSFLQDHIRYIEKTKSRQANQCYFRDPAYGTNNYIFSLRESGSKRPFYKKAVETDDTYQIGYHNAFIYRECCFSCKYTQHDRVGDLSIFDSTGLGKVELFTKTKDNTSFVLVNTVIGKNFISSVNNTNVLYSEERPLDEAFKFNGQLNKPVKGKDSIERQAFFEGIQNGLSFDEAANIAFSGYVKKNKIKSALRLREIKAIVKRFVPSTIKDCIDIKRNKGR